MYTATRSGPRKFDAGVELRALVLDKQPRVMAQALTFTAQRGQKDIVAEMPRVFQGGASRYTLNSTRITPAKVDSLVARVAVKDETTNNGTLPEDYLFPEVYGGPRKEKRFERSLRYGGALKPGARTVLGRSTPKSLLDKQGNLKPSEIQRILTATRTAFDPFQRKTDSRRSKRNAKNAPYFIGGLDSVSIVGGETSVRKGSMQPGIYRRQGKDGGILPVLIFVTKPPSYRRRLDFEGIVERAAAREFQPIFNRLLRKAAGAT